MKSAPPNTQNTGWQRKGEFPMTCRGKKALVIHNTLNSCGGGERVSVAVIETLKEMGFHVTLGTVEPTYWPKVERLLGVIAKPDREIYLLKTRVKAFGIYMRLLTYWIVRKYGMEFDLKINTHGDTLPIPMDIIYMHFPTFALAEYNPVIKYFQNVFWRMYFTPYEHTMKTLAKKSIESTSTIVVTNSKFSEEAIERYVGRKALIIHPPVDFETFSKAFNMGAEREDIVITVGRYTPEKNYEFILRVASEIPSAKFIIIGASSGKISNNYYTKLMRMVRQLGLMNVELQRDVPLSELLKVMARAKVYMHAMINEHFGVAVAEGMSAGLVPVIHRSGGAYTDIIEYDRYGYSYRCIDEAVRAVEKALDGFSKMSQIVYRRAKLFSKENFKTNFRNIIKEIMKT
jgi:glycosyltransferase involved in cell wall biosynthesis